MSLITQSASSVANQVLAYLLRQIGSGQSATPAATASTASTTSKTTPAAQIVSSKPTLSDDTLSMLMQLRQKQSAAGNFLDPAKRHVSQASSSSQTDASNEKMPSVGPVDSSSDDSSTDSSSPDDDSDDSSGIGASNEMMRSFGLVDSSGDASNTVSAAVTDDADNSGTGDSGVQTEVRTSFRA